MSLIKNAAPGSILLGADDKSTKVLKPERDPIPQHCPKFYFFGEKGAETAIPSAPNKWVSLYGKKTFDMNGEYYNDATKYMEAIGGEANTCVLHRIVPDDAGPRSNMTIYVDIIEDDIPNYVRNSSGGYVAKTSGTGYKIDATTPTITGYKVKFIKEVSNKDTDLGKAKQKTGTMSKTVGSVVTNSNMYPILELKAKWKGEYYNNIGISIMSMFDGDVDKATLEKTKAMTYKLGLYTKDGANSSPDVMKTLSGEQSVVVSLKDKAIDPDTDAIFDIRTKFLSDWYNETDGLKALRYNDYEDMFVYNDNIKKVSSLMLDKEKTHITSTVSTWDDKEDSDTESWFDFTTADQTKIDEEMYLLNFLGGKSSKNVNYFTLKYDDSTVTLASNQSEISFSTNTPVFLGGGSNGTMSQTTYEALLVKELKKYSDPDSEVQDTAINVETIMYDTNLTTTTKAALAHFIAVRKNTAVILTTHVHSKDNKVASATDANAIGQTLKTKFKLSPESVFFGTGVARAVIVIGAAYDTHSSYPYILGANYDLAIKMAKMMGAGNYKWKKEYLFDKAPGNVMDNQKGYLPKFIPESFKTSLWSNGLVWAQPYDRTQYHFPGMQTICDNDTSALNNILAMMALCTASTIQDDAWRQFTGTGAMSDIEFIDALTVYFRDRFSGIFADLILMVPEVELTNSDKLRGFSWRVITKLGAYNTRTKAVSSSEIYRQEDLLATIR